MENELNTMADELLEAADRKATELAEQAQKKAEQLADEARKQAARLREKAKAEVRKLTEATGEKISKAKKEVAKSTRSATEKFISAAAMAFGSILIIKFLLGEYSSYSHTKEINDALDSAIKKGESTGKPLSYSLPEYTQFANMIEQATAGIGTNTQVINQVFGNLHNNTDVLQLVKTYGQRPNSFFGVPLGNLTLSQLMVSELSYRERKQLNEMLAQKGITITF